MRVLERDEWTCQKCGQPGTEVHHIKPIHKGGIDPFDEENLMTACIPCHHVLHSESRGISREAWDVRREFDRIVKARIDASSKENKR